MTPVEFPQQTHVLAKAQPQYHPLPVHIDVDSEARPMTCCLELSEEEVNEVIRTKKIWLTQLTFRTPFHPIMLSTQNPFE